jgi:ATP-dependent Clp protease adaptor protein ClpS
LIGTRQSYDEIFDFVRHTIDMSEFTFASSQPGQVQEIDQADETKSDRPWIVIVWNDPINLMSYVTFVFQKLFGYSLEKATELMLDVHHKGRAVVSSGSRERAEFDVYRLHEHGLWATLEHESL